MSALDSLLRPELLASILILASIVMIARGLVHFNQEKAKLLPKLSAAETELEKFRRHTQPRVQQVEELSGAVRKMEQQQEVLLEYLDELKSSLSAADGEGGKDIRIHDLGDE